MEEVQKDYKDKESLYRQQTNYFPTKLLTIISQSLTITQKP